MPISDRISSVSSDEKSDLTQSRRTPSSSNKDSSTGNKTNKSGFSSHSKNKLSNAPLLKKETSTASGNVKKVPTGIRMRQRGRLVNPNI